MNFPPSTLGLMQLLLSNSGKKNQILGRILSKEITVAQAHREYGVAASALHRWLRNIRGEGQLPTVGALGHASKGDAPPLPRGMNLRAAIAAEGYCQVVGMQSKEAGEYCRRKGITLQELQAFSKWINANDDVAPAAPVKQREKELVKVVAELTESQREKNREIARKDRALSEAAALLVLSKKVQALWGDKEN